MHQAPGFYSKRAVVQYSNRSNIATFTIPIPRPFATVTVTCARVRNIVCRRYTNITRVILTRVIFNPGQNGASVDAALVSMG